MSKRITLSNGTRITVDDRDFSKVSRHLWHSWTSLGRLLVARNIPKGEGSGKQYLQALLMKPRKGHGVVFLNGDRSDFRRANMAIVTAQQRAARRSLSKKGCYSKYRGVSWHSARKKWQVVIRNQDRLEWLGHFTDEKEAARAYDKRASKLYGTFASLNFPKARSRPKPRKPA